MTSMWQNEPHAIIGVAVGLGTAEKCRKCLDFAPKVLKQIKLQDSWVNSHMYRLLATFSVHKVAEKILLNIILKIALLNSWYNTSTDNMKTNFQAWKKTYIGGCSTMEILMVSKITYFYLSICNNKII